jgi:hypothetical protein
LLLTSQGDASRQVAGPNWLEGPIRTGSVIRALDLAGLDVRKVRRFSGHANQDTLLKYDDNRRDEAGVLAKMLGEDSE